MSWVGNSSSSEWYISMLRLHMNSCNNSTLEKTVSSKVEIASPCLSDGIMSFFSSLIIFLMAFFSIFVLGIDGELCFVFLDETMTPVQLVFVIAILAGILSLAIVEKRADDGLDREAPHEQETRKGKSDKYRFGALALIFPICYAVIDSLGTFFDSYYLDGDEPILSEFQANTSYELTFLLVGIFALIYLTAVKKQKFSFWGERIFGASALCETAGQFAYIYAIASNSIVAVPVVASYSIFSLLYSRVFLKEKLSLPHYICIAVVVAGIVGLGVLEGLAEA